MKISNYVTFEVYNINFLKVLVMCCSSILLYRILQKSDRYIFYDNSEVLFLISKHIYWLCPSFLVLLSALVKEAFYHW